MDILEDKIHESITRYVPIKTLKKKPPWMNQDIIQLVKRKKKAFKCYQENKSDYRYTIYKKIRSTVSKEIRKAIKNHQTDIVKSLKSNPKRFWNFVNKKLKNKSTVTELKNDDGSFSITDEEKANTLNKQFSKVFTVEDIGNIPYGTINDSSSSLCDIIITEDCVQQKLEKIDPQKAMGPDGIPARFLVNTAKTIKSPLTKIFNKSIEEGLLPQKWKTSNITPLFKKGNKCDPNNYRPVSLTPIVVKILETIIRDEVNKFLEETNFVTNSQFGFRKGKSCTNQLIEVMDDLSTFMEMKESVDIIYFDFKKAFDTVPHERLLYKVNQAGISGNIFKWIKDFLTNRKQRVKLQNAISNESEVISGVPQGSILGPLLFVIYINDLPNTISSKCKLFADDTKIYNISTNNKVLQEDINKLTQWSEKWQLDFNIDKCKILHVGKNNPRCKYQMNGSSLISSLIEVDEEKDIGVTFDTKLNFHNHINKCTSEANKLVGLVRRTFTHYNKDSVRAIIISLIRSKLEYANCIWHPHFKSQSIKIEAVQRRATKLLPCIKNLSYIERLKYLNLTTLKYRRLRGDLIQTFKILKGIDVLNNKIFEFSEIEHTRNGFLKLKKKLYNSTTRSNYLCSRITNQWNRLSLKAKMAENTNQFKNLIDIELRELRYVYD